MNEEVLKTIKEKGLLLEREVFELVNSFQNPLIAKQFLENLEIFSGRKLIGKNVIQQNKEYVRTFITQIYQNDNIYLEKVFAVSDSTKSMLILGILGTSSFGAYFSGRLADKVGLKKSLTIVLASWVIIFPLIGAVSNFNIFVILCVCVGFLYGSVWAISRAAMTALCPPDKLNFGFSFFTLAERVSTLVGPVSWGILTSAFLYLGPTRYRIAMAAMGVFVAIGLFFLRKIDIKKPSLTLDEKNIIL